MRLTGTQRSGRKLDWTGKRADEVAGQSPVDGDASG